MTKVINSEQKDRITAGLLSGIEAFWYNNEKMVIANGTVSRYENSHPEVQRLIYKAFINDTESLTYLSKIGITRFPDTFDRWYKCVIGGLDHVPDISGYKFIPDSFNNMCFDTTCAHRGRLCSRAIGLRNYEIETLSALKHGESLEQTACKLNVSLSGMKSRVEKIKEKLHVPNMAALMVRTTELGI